MQDKEQIQKEIETLRMQLNFADISAITAPEAEKEHWDLKRLDLQSRIKELEQSLEEDVVYDGDHAASILDDETADRMLNEILAAAEARQSDDNTVNKMADAMIDRILAADENDIASDTATVADSVIFGDDSTKSDTDKMADAMIGNILYTSDAPANDMSFDDADADRMLKEILSATEPQIAAESEPVADGPVNDIAGNDEVKDDVFVAVSEPEQTVMHAESRQVDDFASRLESVKATGAQDAEAILQIEKLRLEAEDANRRAQSALAEAEKMKQEAKQIKLAAETERAMYAAEMELRRGMNDRERIVRENEEKLVKEKIAEKIAKRKSEITEIRNGLQEVKDSDSAFALREKLFAVQLVLDDDERNSPEISYLLTKSMDDLSHAVEVSELKRRIAALVEAAKKAPVKKAASAKKKKAAPKPAKKKRPVMATGRRRPPMRPYARRRPSPRYR